jgi:hypothetical protein
MKSRVNTASGLTEVDASDDDTGEDGQDGLVGGEDATAKRPDLLSTLRNQFGVPPASAGKSDSELAPTAKKVKVDYKREER